MAIVKLPRQPNGLTINLPNQTVIYTGTSREDALKALEGRERGEVVYQAGVRTTIAEVILAIEASLQLFPDKQ